MGWESIEIGMKNSKQVIASVLLSGALLSKASVLTEFISRFLGEMAGNDMIAFVAYGLVGTPAIVLAGLGINWGVDMAMKLVKKMK